MSMEVTAWNAMYNAEDSYSMLSPGAMPRQKQPIRWMIERKHVDCGKSWWIPVRFSVL